MTPDEEILLALEEEFDPETVVEILAERVAELADDDDDAAHSFDRIDIDRLAEAMWESLHRANAPDTTTGDTLDIPPLRDTPSHHAYYRAVAGRLASILLDPDRTPLR